MGLRPDLLNPIRTNLSLPKLPSFSDVDRLVNALQ